jgi:hypothetical protein
MPSPPVSGGQPLVAGILRDDPLDVGTGVVLAGMLSLVVLGGDSPLLRRCWMSHLASPTTPAAHPSFNAQPPSSLLRWRLGRRAGVSTPMIPSFVAEPRRDRRDCHSFACDCRGAWRCRARDVDVGDTFVLAVAGEALSAWRGDCEDNLFHLHPPPSNRHDSARRARFPALEVQLVDVSPVVRAVLNRPDLKWRFRQRKLIPLPLAQYQFCSTLLVLVL